MDVQAQADAWVRLRRSEDPQESQRAAWAEMPLAAWLAVLDRYPDMAEWVAHAKRSPNEMTAILAQHPDPQVRWHVAAQRRLALPLREVLAKDPDEDVRTSARRLLKPDTDAWVPPSLITAIDSDATTMFDDESQTLSGTAGRAARRRRAGPSRRRRCAPPRARSCARRPGR